MTKHILPTHAIQCSNLRKQWSPRFQATALFRDGFRKTFAKLVMISQKKLAMPCKLGETFQHGPFAI